MKILFFDTECANCFEGKGKICELGYVVTDVAFNVLSKRNFIINPSAEFDKKGFAMRKIKLSCPYSEYYKQNKFPHHYEEIKSLFTADDILVVGHGTHFDAKYLLDECDRYSLPPFNYRFIDTQEVVKKLYGRETQLRLIELYSEFYPEKAREQMHSGIDDAEMTAAVLQYVCRDKGVTVKELFDDKTLSCDVFDGRIVEGDPFGYNGSSVMGKKNRKLFEQCVKQNRKICDGEAYSFPSEYENKHFKQMVLILSVMTERNMRYTESPKRSFYVTLGDKEWKAHSAKREKIISMDEFLQKIELSKSDMQDENIDVEKIISQLDENKEWYARYSEFKRRPPAGQGV